MRDDLVQNLAEVEADHWWFRARRTLIAQHIRAMQLPTGAHILEMGCGTGGNLDMLSSFGQVHAFEPNPVGRELAAERGLAEVQDGLLPDGIPFGDTQFDLVVGADVLEHVEQDEASLRALCGRTVDGGRLLLTIPAMPRLWSPHDAEHAHKRRYHSKKLAAMLERTGWQVTHMAHWNTLLLPMAAASRIADRLRGGPVRPLTVPPPALNKAFGAVLRLEHGASKRIRWPIGLSLIVTARKA